MALSVNEQIAIAIGIVVVNFPLILLYVVGERRGWIDGPSAVQAKKKLLAENALLCLQGIEVPRVRIGQ